MKEALQGAFSSREPAAFLAVFQWYDVVEYNVDEDTFISYKEAQQLAWQTKPKLLIAGASAYSRQIDFQQFRAIADEVGAFLLAVSLILLAWLWQESIKVP